MTDPISRHRARPIETKKKKKQLSDRNLQTGNNVWLQAQGGLDTKTY
jgi:hypothetical protein